MYICIFIIYIYIYVYIYIYIYIYIYNTQNKLYKICKKSLLLLHMNKIKTES